MMHVLAVDPGKLSGVALLSWDDADKDSSPKVVWSREVDEETFASSVREGLTYHRDTTPLYVTCERFLISAKTAQNSQAPWSLEEIGVLKHLCRENNYDPASIVLQAPADAKSMFPNPALKRLGTWHVGGGGHANDAIRHALLRLVKAGWIPRRLL